MTKFEEQIETAIAESFRKIEAARMEPAQIIRDTVAAVRQQNQFEDRLFALMKRGLRRDLANEFARSGYRTAGELVSRIATLDDGQIAELNTTVPRGNR